MSRACKRIMVAATAVAVGLAPTATASASSTEAQGVAAPALTFSLPAIGGLEIGPGGVPGGSFHRIMATARPGPVEGQVTFAVQDPASNVGGPNYYQYSYRHLLVSWRNLATGATGAVQLRHWDRPGYEYDSPSEKLPTSANAITGSGPVVATVSEMRTPYQSPPVVINPIPGVIAIAVP